MCLEFLLYEWFLCFSKLFLYCLPLSYIQLFFKKMRHLTPTQDSIKGCLENESSRWRRRAMFRVGFLCSTNTNGRCRKAVITAQLWWGFQSKKDALSFLRIRTRPKTHRNEESQRNSQKCGPSIPSQKACHRGRAEDQENSQFLRTTLCNSETHIKTSLKCQMRKGPEQASV